MTSWLIYSSSHPQCRAHSGCSVFVEWKSKQIKRSFISSKGRARHEYSVFTGASDMLEDLEKWIWAKGKFSKRWGHSNPNRVSCGGRGGGCSGADYKAGSSVISLLYIKQYYFNIKLSKTSVFDFVFRHQVFSIQNQSVIDILESFLSRFIFL